ncbi:hypothetical protein BD560DRAFT_446822 [Blakeslea trispora]|nr:hypothetical protein BD560DRAFT_446822 [Blakeslea trispora]
MAALLAKKEEELNAQKLQELLRRPENKKCFDCPTKSPFFVNVSIHTFVCTRCSGLVREVGHRVKSISASKFSGPEIVALEYGGNGVARTIWLHGYNHNLPEPETDGDVRMFMRQKYYEQKWLDRQKGMIHAEQVKRIISDMFQEDGTRKKKQAKPNLTIEPKPPMIHSDSWVDDNVPIGLISTVKNSPSRNDVLQKHISPTIQPISPTFKSMSPISPTFQSTPQNTIFSDLASLDQAVTNVDNSINYMGGILQPKSPSSITSPIIQKPLDPYEALRDLSIGHSRS